MGIYALTGGATGIGAAIKQRLLESGHRVIVVDIKGDDTDIIADLGTLDGRIAALDGIRALAGTQLDGFIPCAGVGPHVPERTLIARLNYFAAIELTEGLQPLLAQGGGSVVLISSVTAAMIGDDPLVQRMLDGDETGALALAETADPQHIYSCTKRGLARWMRNKVSDFALNGIRINAIAPGYINTPLNEAGEKDPVYGPLIKEYLDSTPAGYPGEPEDIAAATAFLLGKEARFIFGSMLFVDGGADAMSRPDQF